MTRIARVVLVAIFTCGIIGCAAPKKRSEPTMPDIVACVQTLIKNMETHLKINYNAAKAARKDKLPIVCLLTISNDTSSEALKHLCRPIDNVLISAIFDTGAFELVDDEASEIIKSRIIFSADGGIENANELMAGLGEHIAPDYIVTGVYFGDDRFYLRLTVHDLHTSRLVWTGFEEIEQKP